MPFSHPHWLEVDPDLQHHMGSSQKGCFIYGAPILLLEFNLNPLVCPAFQANGSLSDTHWCFLLICMCLCVWCLFACVSKCVLMSAYRSKRQAYGGLRWTFLNFSSPFSEARFLPKSNMSRPLTECNIVSLTGELGLRVPCFYFLWIYMGKGNSLPTWCLCGCWGFKIWCSHMHSKHFTHWTIFVQALWHECTPKGAHTHTNTHQ